MFTIFHFYLMCFFVGFFYAIVSGILSGVFGGGEADIDASGVDVDVGGVDVDIGDVDVGGVDVDVDVGDMDIGDHDVGGIDADSGGLHLSPLSPVTIAMFTSSFGATGSILTRFAPGFGNVPTLGVALVSGLIIAGSTMWLFWRIFRSTQESSEARTSDIIGLDAEVLTAIPAEGFGEVAYVARGTRFNSTARSIDGKEIPSNATVTIKRIVGNVCYVRRTTDYG
jgi:membrane protein implicated in regulation of membrane protease activity